MCERGRGGRDGARETDVALRGMGGRRLARRRGGLRELGLGARGVRGCGLGAAGCRRLGPERTRDFLLALYKGSLKDLVFDVQNQIIRTSPR